MAGYHKKVKYKDVFLEYAKLLNGYLQLTDRELQFFSYLLRFEIEYNSDFNPIKNILSRENRKYIMQETYISKNNLSKYASVLRDKSILRFLEDGKSYEVNPMLVPKIFRTGEGNYKMETQFIIEYIKEK